jgi:catechol 2,3-dioxygenase-like lactoylglutathione lyase family enzyme
VTEPLVRQLDHVFAPVRDPAPLFDLFSNVLGLPVAWPVTDKGDFTSAAVCLGNANLEFISANAASALSPFLEPTEPMTVRGLAFEPADGSRMASQLDERGFTHSGPVPHSDAGGSWTNVFLSGLAPHAAMVFLCDYLGDTLAERRAVREEFRAGDGGVLGVRRLGEVTLGVLDVDGAMENWTRFLAPARADDHGAFHVGSGPVVRLKASPIDGVAGLWLEVASLAAARDALRERDLLGPMRGSGIGMDYTRTGGLDVWLSEGR